MATNPATRATAGSRLATPGPRRRIEPSRQGSGRSCPWRRSGGRSRGIRDGWRGPRRGRSPAAIASPATTKARTAVQRRCVMSHHASTTGVSLSAVIPAMTTPAAVSRPPGQQVPRPHDPADEQRVQVPDADVVHDRDRQQQDRQPDQDRPPPHHHQRWSRRARRCRPPTRRRAPGRSGSARAAGTAPRSAAGTAAAPSRTAVSGRPVDRPGRGRRAGARRSAARPRPGT